MSCPCIKEVSDGETNVQHLKLKCPQVSQHAEPPSYNETNILLLAVHPQVLVQQDVTSAEYNNCTLTLLLFYSLVYYIYIYIYTVYIYIYI